MKCFEILVNGKRVAVIGHADAQCLTASVETNPEIDAAIVDLTAELPVRDGKARFASWPDATLRVGDDLTIRVVEVERADDPVTVIGVGVGQTEAQETPWPICVTCGKPWYETEGMVGNRGVRICNACLEGFVALRQK